MKFLKSQVETRLEYAACSMPHRLCCIGQDVPGKLKLSFWWNSFYLSLFWTDWIKRQWECFINWNISEKRPFNDSKNVTKCHFNWYFWPSNTVFSFIFAKSVILYRELQYHTVPIRPEGLLSYIIQPKDRTCFNNRTVKSTRMDELFGNTWSKVNFQSWDHTTLKRSSA